MDVQDNVQSDLPPHPSQLGLSGDINALTTGLKSHFEAILLENQRLKQERDQARQQLTHLMYLRDGATRVVGRQLDEINLLKRQIDELNESLQKARRFPSTGGTDNTDISMDDQDNLNENALQVAYKEALERFNNLSRDLLQNRKQRCIEARPGSDFSLYQTATSSATSSSTTTTVGATCFSNLISGLRSAEGPTRRMPYIYAVGRKDGTLNVHSWQSPDPLAVLRGHEGAITCLESLVYPCTSHLRPSALAALCASSSSSAPFKSVLNLFSGGADGTVRIWTERNMQKMDDIDFLEDVPVKASGGSVKYAKADPPRLEPLNFVCDHVFRLNKSSTKLSKDFSVSTVKLHPAGTHLAIATTSIESGWAFADIVSMRVLKRFVDSKYKCSDLAFQPDGNVVVGIDSSARVLPVWDFRSPEMKAAPAASDISGQLTSIDFSESGYHIITTSSCGKAQLWDLRRVEVIQEYDLGDSIHKARFDFSGRHILFAGKFGTVLYSTQEKKKLAQVASWDSNVNILDAQFDHISDDYFLTLGEDGQITSHSAP